MYSHYFNVALLLMHIVLAFKCIRLNNTFSSTQTAQLSTKQHMVEAVLLKEKNHASYFCKA